MEISILISSCGPVEKAVTLSVSRVGKQNVIASSKLCCSASRGFVYRTLARAKRSWQLLEVRNASSLHVLFP